MFWVTKKKLRRELDRAHKEIVDMTEELYVAKEETIKADEAASYYARCHSEVLRELDMVLCERKNLGDALAAKQEEFPFSVGATLYQVMLRSANGRFTKKKASRAHSTVVAIVVAIVVDEKNYFKIRKGLNTDYFMSERAANQKLDEVCVTQ